MCGYTSRMPEKPNLKNCVNDSKTKEGSSVLNWSDGMTKRRSQSTRSELEEHTKVKTRVQETLDGVLSLD